MMKTILFVSFFIASNFSLAQEEEQPVLKGVYTEINVLRDNHFIELLSIDSTRSNAIDSILTNPDSFNPSVLYVLSNVLFKEGKKDEAMFWFYTGQLRARNDANLCLDKTASQMVSQLNNLYGPDINKYAFQDIEKLKVTVKKVVEYVRGHTETYDHRWISLHGMGAFLSAKKSDAIIAPEKDWDSIKKKTIDDYYSGFEKAIKSME